MAGEPQKIRLVEAYGSGNIEAGSWQFPLLLKLRSPGILFRPFMTGGVSFQRLGDVKQFVSGAAGAITGGDPDELRRTNNRGFVLGAGFEVRTPIIRLSPEFRYTRWGSETFRDTLNLLRTNQNQADFLIGLTF